MEHDADIWDNLNANDEFVALLRPLSRWRVSVFATGCALRVWPIVDSLGTPHQRQTIRESVDALLANPEGMTSELAAALRAPLDALTPDGPFDLAYDVTITVALAFDAATLPGTDPVDDAVQARLEALSAWRQVDLEANERVPTSLSQVGRD